ncbi:hypothetical protein [Prosthecochloris sp. CIB 2401]|uniref:hypothetical protein n=1 Tax=Prosthecochloris sp. CIB 2401 TaxID=1868325 RepID=UPI00080AAF42|nr:hypothetical protein [Prosthecochloris sp. CIB 2401]ANT65259.1 hypothetical protein Ptc2401_01507 [Prosthecochloris sp. CIB 2401]
MQTDAELQQLILGIATEGFWDLSKDIEATPLLGSSGIRTILKKPVSMITLFSAISMMFRFEKLECFCLKSILF